MASSTSHRHRIGALALAALVVATAGGVAGATTAGGDAGEQAQVEATPPAFVVALNGDGSARVVVSYTFDLTDEVRRAAFEELRANGAATEQFRERYRTRLAAVAGDAANATGREMIVSDVEATFVTSGETGVVTLSATWDGLAAVDGDRLTVAEPFASGFEPDRRFVVVTDGSVASVTPAPDSRTDGRLSWASGTSLAGFELVATADGDGTDDGTDGPETAGDGGPGLDVLVGVLALLGATVLALWRR